MQGKEKFKSLLYISSVALHPKYHNSGAFKLLYDALILLIIELFKREIYFSKVIADAVSPIGEKLCKYIGMVKCEDSKHQSKILKAVITHQYKIHNTT